MNDSQYIQEEIQSYVVIYVGYILKLKKEKKSGIEFIEEIDNVTEVRLKTIRDKLKHKDLVR